MAEIRAVRTAPVSAPHTANMLPSMGGRASRTIGTPGEATSEGCGHLHHRLTPGQHARHMLLDHHVEIGAAKTESRQGRSAADRTTAFSQGWALVFTKSGILSQGILGFGWFKLIRRAEGSCGNRRVWP